jgi:basic amino acid/polyamine antiporter, APA family
MSNVTAPNDESSAQSHSGFIKAITLTDATMLVAGAMIGSGIFIVSADMGRSVGSPGWLLMAWLLTGVMTCFGALTYGELAAMFPRAGGQYIFLRESFSPLVGFLYGWTLFAVIQTGTIAAVGVAFGKFLGVLAPSVSPDIYAWFPHHDVCVAWLGCSDPSQAIQFGLSPQRLIALVSIAVLTWVNLRGVREGKFVQTSLTIVKTGVLVLLMGLGLTIGRNSSALAANFGHGNFWGHVDITGAWVVAFGAAFVGSLFSSDAWNNVTFAAAEVKNPKRNLPLALIMGTGLVTMLYFLTNISYLSVLPFHGDPAGATVLARGLTHATQDRVGTAAMEQMFGSAGGTMMAIGILISTFGCMNGLILAGARVYYAMSRDGLFFRAAGSLSARGVPAVGLVLQTVWTAALCLSGTYGQLLNYVIFANLVFYVLTTAGLFVLRSRRPDAERPYRVLGYPFVPGLYLAMAAGVMILILMSPQSRTEAVSGLVIVAIGIPVYYLWRAVEKPAV